MNTIDEPISHFFYSHRLKLQLWDWGTAGKPTMILVHGGLDHARNWDWVARELCKDFHVYAHDLRGHGNSQQAHGALYSVAEHVLDLSALVDVITTTNKQPEPIYLIGHSLGGVISTLFTGIFPEKVKKLVSIEGLGPPPTHKVYDPASKRMRRWIDEIRKIEKREPRSYPDLDSAVSRMQEANPHLSDEVAQHLTLHGTNWNSDGSLSWKFDNFARPFPPFGHNLADIQDVYGQITCPVLLFWGMESWAPDPEKDGRATPIKNHRLVKVANAGHWVHHDQLDVFLTETKKFLAEE